jgi:uncharacterized protein YndB with AHSA1/START domain
MRFEVGRSIAAPIENVFAFFDDPHNTIAYSPHARRVKVIETRADGCRTYDVWMQGHDKAWMQTVEQVLREPPRRLVNRSWSWSDDRSKRVLSITSDRQFSEDVGNTFARVWIDVSLVQPLRRPFDAARNLIFRGATQLEFEHQLDVIGKRIEATKESTE